MSKSVFVAAAGLSLALAGPAAAQSGFLKNLARQAAAAAIQNAAQPQQPAQPAAGDGAQADGTDAGEPVQYAQAAQTPQTSGPAPWPTNVGAPSVKSPMHLKFSDELEGQKKAFLEFSKVRCGDCEGGYAYDAWAQHFVRLDGSWKAWEKKLGALAMGETLSWQGSQSKGAITVVGEEPVNGWPCKQLRWTLTRPDAKAERPGLICNARAEGAPDWTIAF